MTRGQDITEAFFSHHLDTAKLEPILKKYRVKETTQPRNVKLTFREDGFYMTLRRKVAAKLPEIRRTTNVYSKVFFLKFNSLFGMESFESMKFFGMFFVENVNLISVLFRNSWFIDFDYFEIDWLINWPIFIFIWPTLTDFHRSFFFFK